MVTSFLASTAESVHIHCVYMRQILLSIYYMPIWVLRIQQ